MEPGDLLAERYRLVALIGRGAMGIVWRAQDERLDRVVAVKELLLETTADEEQRAEATARAMREARIAGRLKHPNAIAVHDVVEHDGRPCLVMEYLPAVSLAALIDSRGPLPPEEVTAIGVQVAAALVEAHGAGIVHRDIKPDNVLIAPDGTAKITDFGVSRAAGDAKVTATGFVAGTPAYLAPEVAVGQDGDARADVYSLGSTLYHALEGEPPFGVDDNVIAMLHKVAAGDAPAPLRAGNLTGLVRWLLRDDPEERPTMRDAHDALSAAARGERLPDYKRRAGTRKLPASPAARRTVLAGILAVGLVTVGAVLGVLISDRPSTGATAPPTTTGLPTGLAPPATTTPPTTDTSAADLPEPGCSARFRVTDSWQGGYNAEVIVRNDGARQLSGWSVRWTMPDGHQIGSVWNGVLSGNRGAVTVTNADWNVTVPAGGSTSFGMSVQAANANRYQPQVDCGS
jgi:protein kinase-like protein/cellulose binding protein with CBM2 domain